MGINMDDIWKLIKMEADAISGYSGFLESDCARTSESEPVIATVQRIIADKRDHLAALQYLYDALSKNKPATDMTEFARHTLADHREKNKLIK